MAVPSAVAAPRGCDRPRGVLRIQTSPPQWLLRDVALLHRPAREADRPPAAVRRGLGRLGLQAVFARFIRRPAPFAGEPGRVYVFAGVERAREALATPRCLARLGPRARRRARARNRRLVRRRLALCLLVLREDLRIQFCQPAPAPSALSPRYLSRDIVGEGATRLQGVVPNRVASVEVVLSDGIARTATPVDNRWVLLGAPEGPPRQSRWLDADGREIARYVFPS